MQRSLATFNPRSSVYDGKIAGLYDLEQTLGTGHFAVVKLARHVFTGEKVAVKVIDKTKLDEVSRAHLFQEVRCMKLVQHPNVVRLYEVIDTQTKLYLALEFADGGDLYDYIMRHESGLSENLAREYFRQIVRAISYCHQLHVVHRDLKPENVVFFEKLGVVKLTDFGFSNKFCPGQKLETSCGSLAYSAPEILLGDSYDAPAVDVWSLGVILYMLVCGSPPFQEANDSETLTMIMDCKYTMPNHISEGCKNLIKSMLVREPTNRATLQEISKNDWLMEGADQPNQPEFMPLVSREQVSDDDHALIIQKMVSGNIATKEEILEALDKNEYNHITATYFLLAERKLRAHRQEHDQKNKRPETLPITQNSRHENGQELLAANLLNVPGAMTAHTNIVRTPGSDMAQKGRNRKCSIVQEDNEDDEDEVGSGREELSSPLNRRGSRSEGRINLAVQDRLAAEAVLKKESITIGKYEADEKADLIDGIAGMKIIKTDTPKEKYLGMAGIGNNRKINLSMQKNLEIRSNSLVDKSKIVVERKDLISTKVLTDSSTINIVPKPTISVVNTSQLPKFKTMPSPTRPTAIITTGTNCLKDIFEEATDAGSSDTSNTTTPRPVLRSAGLVSSENCPPGQTHTRRTKFHKTRTTSCSSSDASDDDNADSRKKRANKILQAGESKPFSSHQRRDSYDDSSDSQDPGNNKGSTASGGAASNGALIIRCTKNGTSNGTSGTTTTPNSSQNEKNRKNNCTKSSSGNDLCYRRAGRRRPVETRLRESQSLNRITEVQEVHEVQIPIVDNRLAPYPGNSGRVENTADEPDDEEEASGNQQADEDDDDENKVVGTKTDVVIVIGDIKEPDKNNVDEKQQQQQQSIPASNSPGTKTPNKSFSARLFQNFKKSSNRHQKPTIPTISVTLNNNEESSCVPEAAVLSDLDRKSTNIRNSSNGTSKKIKILGRYFQVHKKICMPLSGLFQRGGRLYKTQSCGSIVRDKINHSTKMNTNTLTSSSRNKYPDHLAPSGFQLIGGSDEQLDKHCPNQAYLYGIGSEAENQQQMIDKYIDDPCDSDDNEIDGRLEDSPAKTPKHFTNKQVNVSLCSKC